MDNHGEDVAENRASVETRRRRALYRATHRGTKEMDWLLGKFASARVDYLDPGQLVEFEALVNLPDVTVEELLLGQSVSKEEPDLQNLVANGTIFSDSSTSGQTQ